MENLSAYRYCIAMKKGRKIFIIIAGCTMILISSIFIILTVIFYVLEQEFGFYTFLGTLLIPLIFFIFGILGIVAATKRVEIYKGKVVYHIGFISKNIVCLILEHQRLKPKHIIQDYILKILYLSTVMIK